MFPENDPVFVVKSEYGEDFEVSPNIEGVFTSLEKAINYIESQKAVWYHHVYDYITHSYIYNQDVTVHVDEWDCYDHHTRYYFKRDPQYFYPVETKDLYPKVNGKFTGEDDSCIFCYDYYDSEGNQYSCIDLKSFIIQKMYLDKPNN